MNPLSEPNVSKLLDTLFYSTDINTLIECAANILKNPISIYNTAFFCVGLSNKKGVDDDLWQQGAIGENIKYEYASNLHDLEQKYRENTVKYKYFYENLDGFGSHRRRVILMIFNSVVIGYMNVLQYHVDFEEIPEELYEIVVGALTKALSVSRTLAYYGGSHNKDKESLEGLLYDLLSEDYASEYFYFQRVNGTVFEKEGNYRILAVNIENAKLISASIGDLKLSLLATFPRSWSVIIEKHVVVLVDCGKTDSISEKSLSNLDMILNELKIYVGISDSFHSLYYAKKYLYQAEATADIVHCTPGKKLLGFFEQYKLWCCASIISEHFGDTYIGESIRSLVSHDEANGTDYFRTLFFYLDSGRDIVLTAKRLHVHKNTVYYRLERMKLLFDINGTDKTDEYQNYFSCLVQYLNNNKNLD